MVPFFVMLPVLGFPILTKLHMYHLNREILFCLPVPGLHAHIAISTWMLIPYCIFILKQVKEIAVPSEKGPQDAAFPCTEITNYQFWLFMQFVDTYTEVTILFTGFGRMPTELWCGWAVTAVISSLTWIATLVDPDNRMVVKRFIRLLCMQVFLEDIPQICLSCLSMFVTQTADQYVLYSLVLAVLAVLVTLRKILCSGIQGETFRYSELDTTPSGDDVSERSERLHFTQEGGAFETVARRSRQAVELEGISRPTGEKENALSPNAHRTGAGHNQRRRKLQWRSCFSCLKKGTKVEDGEVVIAGEEGV